MPCNCIVCSMTYTLVRWSSEASRKKLQEPKDVLYSLGTPVRWILKILHDPKYLIPWELRYYSIGSCRILVSTVVPFFPFIWGKLINGKKGTLIFKGLPRNLSSCQDPLGLWFVVRTAGSSSGFVVFGLSICADVRKQDRTATAIRTRR